MIIDEKGKLFGKISIIDFAVIAVLALAIIGGALIYFGGVGRDNAVKMIRQGDTLNEVSMTMTLQNVRDITRDGLHVGDEVYSVKPEKPIGIIEKVESKPFRELVTGVDGTMVYADIPEKYDVTIYIKLWGAETGTGCMTEYNQKIATGESLTIKTVAVQTTPKVENISINPDVTKIAENPNRANK